MCVCVVSVHVCVDVRVWMDGRTDGWLVGRMNRCRGGWRDVDMYKPTFTHGISDTEQARIQDSEGGVVHSEGGVPYRNFRSGSKLLQGPGQINKQTKLQTAVGWVSDHPKKNPVSAPDEYPINNSLFFIQQ